MLRELASIAERLERMCAKRHIISTALYRARRLIRDLRHTGAESPRSQREADYIIQDLYRAIETIDPADFYLLSDRLDAADETIAESFLEYA